jgi:Neuraminidase (sialidase)
MKIVKFLLIFTFTSLFSIGTCNNIASSLLADDSVYRNVLLPPGPDNPRNSEGDFIGLNNGKIMFIYTHFTGGGGDHDAAHLAARFSEDGGQTWTEEDKIVVSNEAGMNVMSVSLLRLHSGDIALFYMQKNSLEDTRPVLRLSSDEGKTWSKPSGIIPDEEIGYYVLNNDRVVQLSSGRLVVPVARHNDPSWEEWSPYGHIACYLSDDEGKTWHRSTTVLNPTQTLSGDSVLMQEPGIIELSDNRLMMFIRTDEHVQYKSYSVDQGQTWINARPSNITSPRSPASIERIPSTGDLILVWNNNGDNHKRTPFNVAISKNEGKSWENIKVLEDDPHGWYCYTSIYWNNDKVLLGHCAGDRRKGGLNTTQITSFPIDWLYK